MNARKPRPRRYRWLDGIVTYNGHAVANGAKPLSDSAVLVAMLLGQLYAKPDGTAVRVSQATISEDTGIPVSTVKKAVAQLRAAGVIAQTKGHNRRSATEYALVVTPVMRGYGADEAGDASTLVGTADGPYEPVDSQLVGTSEILVGTIRDSRRDHSPSREQMNSSRTGLASLTAAAVADALAVAYCDSCGQPSSARIRHLPRCQLVAAKPPAAELVEAVR
jgi:hypothetical protein